MTTSSSSGTLRKGTSVRWNWGQGTATGKIAERFERRVSRTIKGKRIARYGTHDNPAYIIEQEDGARVLKRGSELERA
ncbi:DUF2945 domain-containing protein [Novosphingobium sp. P6W]|uniref:DUF2945 domain-containing protein n=1 Tax=Novosphingobium sp. P6W TaxID=1609758 RepID=UPI0005C2D1B0|nr:DUF2945 domain-containing protein [Novosphingobium sp. P6W]AXB77566.1 DUF2945 domain-containing protein [Novosphingobium sp. P6W]KIS33927.1 hypothetical protein TQ38_04410 [Novosphingobium sp. P6W]